MSRSHSKFILMAAAQIRSTAIASIISTVAALLVSRPSHLAIGIG